MHLSRCTHCGAQPSIPCPICGNPDTLPVVYGYPIFPPDDDVVLGGCIVTGTDPERTCKNCGFGFWPGHRNPPAFFDNPWGHTTAETSRPTPPQAADLRHMIELAVHYIDDSLAIVADEHALDGALDPTVDDRWWWNHIGDLQPVCSPACRDEALQDPDTVPFALWRHSQHGWVHTAGVGSDTDRTSLVHLSSQHDPVGVLVLLQPHGSTLITPPGGGPTDPNLLTWPPRQQWPV